MQEDVTKQKKRNTLEKHDRNLERIKKRTSGPAAIVPSYLSQIPLILHGSALLTQIQVWLCLFTFFFKVSLSLIQSTFFLGQ